MENLSTSSGNKKPERNELGQLLPGNTANPAGRPPGTLSLVSLIKKKLEEIDPATQKTNAEVLITEILDRAKKGNDKLMRDLINRIDGMPIQAIDMNANATFRTFEIVRGKINLPNATNEGENTSGSVSGTDAPVA